jgi:hypothetical protein
LRAGAELKRLRKYYTVGIFTHNPPKNYANLRIAGAIRFVLQGKSAIKPLPCYAGDLSLFSRCLVCFLIVPQTVH